MPSDLASIATAIGTAVIAVATCVAAWKAAAAASATEKSANAARLGTQSQVMMRLVFQYASAEMGASVRLLRRVYDDKDGRPPSEGERLSPEEDNARRTVHWFVKSAAQLWKAGTISDDQFKLVVVHTRAYPLWADFARFWSRVIDTSHEVPPEELGWDDEVVKKFPPPKRRPPKVPKVAGDGETPRS